MQLKPQKTLAGIISGRKLLFLKSCYTLHLGTYAVVDIVLNERPWNLEKAADKK